jgi:hypothetical protein
MKNAFQFVCERPRSPPGSLPNVAQKGEKKISRDARVLSLLMIRKELVQTCTSYSLCSDYRETGNLSNLPILRQREEI